MTSAHLRIAAAAAALAGLAAVPASAQRPLTPEQRVMMLEQQLAASQAAAIRLEQRLQALERQIQQLVNQSEVTGHRAGSLDSEIAKLRADMDRRLSALESRPASVETAQTAEIAVEEEPEAEDAPARPQVQTASASAPELPPKATDEAEADDPGEEAYSVGFRLWRDGDYDESITALRAFLSGFPKHRRASFARNLVGRALLDKGEPRPAAEALLANYRADPKGERAPDSLYYLGQALIELNQPAQACKAYAELEDVYGDSVRPDLKALVTKGKTQAQCS